MKTTNEVKKTKGYLAGDFLAFQKNKNKQINNQEYEIMIMILYNILPDIKEST